MITERLVLDDLFDLLEYADWIQKGNQPDASHVSEREFCVLRLIGAELLTKDGEITQKGRDRLTDFELKKVLLREGIPWEKRKKSSEPNRLTRVIDKKWLFGTFNKKDIVGNGEFLYYGKPIPSMKVVGTKGKHSVIFKTIRFMVKIRRIGKWEAVKVHTYQKILKPEEEVAWLSNKDQSFFIPVQLYYLDFLFNKFPTVSFMARDHETAIQIKRPQEKICGYLMPIHIKSILRFSEPKKIENWEEKFEISHKIRKEKKLSSNKVPIKR